MSLLALVVALALGDPSPPGAVEGETRGLDDGPSPPAVRSLADRIAAEHARNAGLPPLAPPRPTPLSPRRSPRKYEPEPATRSIKFRPATPVDHPDYPDLLLDLALTFDAKRTYYLEQAAALDDSNLPTTAHLDRLRSKRAKFRAQAAEAVDQQLKVLKVLSTTPQFKGRAVEEGLYLYTRELIALDRPEGFDAAIRLIEDFPNSPYRPYAYALFAHRYLLKGKLADARQLVAPMLAQPRGPLAASGHLYLGWSYMHAEAGEGPSPDLALAHFTRAIEASTTPDDTLRSALDGLVHAHAAAGRPDRAHAHFTRLAALQTRDPRLAITLQERLALAYFARGQHRESATVYRGLLKRHPDDPETCAWQTRLLLTAVALHDRDAQLREALRLAAAYERLPDRQSAASTVTRCRDDARDALTDLTTQWHTADPPRAIKTCAAHDRLFPDHPLPHCQSRASDAPAAR